MKTKDVLLLPDENVEVRSFFRSLTIQGVKITPVIALNIVYLIENLLRERKSFV